MVLAKIIATEDDFCGFDVYIALELALRKEMVLDQIDTARFPVPEDFFAFDVVVRGIHAPDIACSLGGCRFQSYGENAGGAVDDPDGFP